MKKSVAIIGLGRFGLSLVESFSKLNVEIIAIDKNVEYVKKASEMTTNAFIVDSTDEEALKSVGVSNVDQVIVAFGQNEKNNLAASVITIIKLKELGIKNIIARADEDDYVEILKLIGATEIVTPLYIASERIANRVASENVVDYFNIKNDFNVFEVKVQEDFTDLALIDLDLRTKYSVNILLIERDNETIIPTKSTIIKANDDIFIFGRKRDIPKITTFFNKKVKK